MRQLVTVAWVATALLAVLTIIAVVLFTQHETDRAATRHAASKQPVGLVCPTDPSSTRYNPQTAGKHVTALSEC